MTGTTSPTRMILSKLDENRFKRRATRREGSYLGRVVEFRRGGGHSCGAMLCSRHRFLRVIDQDGREPWLSRDRVVDIGRERIDIWSGHEAIRKMIHFVHRRRNELKRRLDLRTLWEVVIDEGPDHEWTLPELADLYFGPAVGIDDVAAMSRALDDGNLFQKHDQDYLPLPRETVRAHDTYARAAETAKARARAAADWIRAASHGRDAPRPADADDIVSMLADYVIFEADSEHAHAARQLMHDANMHGRQGAFQALVHLGHWDEDVNLDLLRYSVPTVFPQEALDEAGRIKVGPSPIKTETARLTHVYGISDPGQACAQAVSIRRGKPGLIVGLHMACPALVLAPRGALQSAAAERGASIRLPEQSHPMFPDALVSKVALNTRTYLPSLTAEFHFDADMELLSQSLRICRIRPRQILSVEAMDDLLGQGGLPGKLATIARQLCEARRARGGIVLTEPDLQISIANGDIHLHQTDPATPAAIVRRELLTLVNALAGSFCKEHDLAALYQVEAAPTRCLVEGNGADPVASFAQMKLMPRVAVQVDPEPHHGLGVARYAPMTAATESYVDLLVQQEIVHFLQTDRARYTRDEMADAFYESRAAWEQAHAIEEASRRYWLLKYLEQRRERTVEAVVLDRSPGGSMVRLCETRLITFLPVRRGRPQTPGDRVQVAVVSVSSRRNMLRVRATR